MSGTGGKTIVPVCYATATGTAEEFASQLISQYAGGAGGGFMDMLMGLCGCKKRADPAAAGEGGEDEKQVELKLMSFEQLDVKMFGDYKVWIILSSSTGDGDPPEMAIDFWRWLEKAKKEDAEVQGLKMDDVKFALFGLGDSGYATFQGFPNKLDTGLQKLGATHFFGRGIGDDRNDISSDFAKWIGGGLFAAMEKEVGAGKGGASAAAGGA